MAILHTLRALGYLAINRVESLRRTPKRVIDPRFATTYVYVGFRMMDMFGHVNNARYLEIAEFARWRSLWGIGGLVKPSQRHKEFQVTESKTDRATGERKKVSSVVKSRAPYAFVVASAHLQYARPMSCFQFAKVECILVGMTPGRRGLWMMQRIYDSKDRLCCQVYFRASMIDFKTGKGVSLKEAYAMSDMGDRILELDRQHLAEAGVTTTHADTAEYAAMTAEQKLEADFSAMCRRAFIFGDTELSREALEKAAPGVMRHHPYIAMYDEAEQSERKSLRGVVPTRSKTADGKRAADVFRAELESAVVVRPPRKAQGTNEPKH